MLSVAPFTVAEAPPFAAVLHGGCLVAAGACSNQQRDVEHLASSASLGVAICSHAVGSCLTRGVLGPVPAKAGRACCQHTHTHTHTHTAGTGRKLAMHTHAHSSAVTGPCPSDNAGSLDVEHFRRPSCFLQHALPQCWSCQGCWEGRAWGRHCWGCCSQQGIADSPTWFTVCLKASANTTSWLDPSCVTLVLNRTHFAKPQLPKL